MTAEVIPFPMAPRSCWDCKFGYVGQAGVFCTVFADYIVDETEAEECESWEL